MRNDLWNAVSCFLACVHGQTIVYKHGWDTVADVMGMHGKFRSPDALPSDSSVAFAANHYKMITTGGGCPKESNMTLEDATLSVASRIKSINPKVKVGMYWRTDMALEIAQCSNGTAELKAHGNDWFVRDDNGTLVKEHGRYYMLDYENSDLRKFFIGVLVNVVNQTLPSGAPIIDYIYLDGPGWNGAAGINAKRSAQFAADKLQWMHDLQREFDMVPGGRNVILNGVDNVATAQSYRSTGVAGVMLDHWSILQFLLRGAAFGCNAKNDTITKCGKFNATAMDQLFDLARSQTLSNLTLQIKGWVGPVIKQQGHYPPYLQTPSTPVQQQQVAGERFNSELALFLLVAEEHMYWIYSWFWGFDSYVPGQSDSQVPRGFFPQARCQLGPPSAPPKRVANTWTYKREFEFASVFVDLNNRTASRVDFKGRC